MKEKVTKDEKRLEYTKKYSFSLEERQTEYGTDYSDPLIEYCSELTDSQKINSNCEEEKKKKKRKKKKTQNKPASQPIKNNDQNIITENIPDIQTLKKSKIKLKVL